MTLAEIDQLHLNLGFAIAKWQDVERGVFNTFHKISRTRRHIASAIFFQLISFEARLAITNAAAVVALDGTGKLPKWLKLYERVGDNQAIRNNLAHFLVTKPANANARRKYTWGLSPNPLNAIAPDKYANRPPPFYDLKQVETFAQAFIKLGSELDAFAASLR